MGSPAKAAGRPALILALLCWQAAVIRAAEIPLPEPPANPPDIVAAVNGRTVQGHIDERRSTFDGRVQIRGSGEGARRLYAARIERFTRHLVEQRATTESPPLKLDPAIFHASKAPDAQPGHVAICDPYLAEGTAKNPYACSWAGRPADCYDVAILMIVVTAGSDPASELWTVPVTITVRQPKTRNATVAAMSLRGPPVQSPIRRFPKKAGSKMLEPVVSGDGRLVVMNVGDRLLYSVMDPGDAPCDARNWRKVDHVSKMHRDPRMARYGIATYPIRDSENRPVRKGKALRGAYPWIDREARQLFFMQVGTEVGLFYPDGEGGIGTRFEVLNPPRKRQIEFQSATRFGMSFFGLWSQGKIVVPDGRVNNGDFHLGKDRYKPQVVLYDDDPTGVTFGKALTVDLNSPENQWNYLPGLRPRSPRDVIWWLSASNGMTGEVVFDDALDLGTLIFSPMNATVDNKHRRWRDGFDYRGREGYTVAPRVQNAAASDLLWNLPAYGRLSGARIEPVAAGGVTGKGLWLDGERGRLEYDVPAPTSAARMDGATWTTALWLDPRELGTRRRLLTFPDGSWLDVAAGGFTLGSGSGTGTALSLPAPLQLAPRRWTHLALVSSPAWTDLYLDGYKLASVQGSWLRVREGTLTVGRPRDGALPGFHGWIDELRVASGERDPEVVCNWARGTLRGLDEALQPDEFAAAGSYPAEVHDQISARLAAVSRRSWERYRCERERDAAHPCLEAIQNPAGGDASCVRPGLLFPEGPLHHDLPRPDSRANPFCESCHLLGHPTPSLRAGRILEAGPPGTTLSDDDRRQPAQAPVRLHGFVPRELLGLASDVVTPPEGMLLDPLLYPGALNSPPPR